MEDEAREVPAGWVRQFDPTSHHQYFVDTTADPPRSIWHHPYDDEEYLASLSPTERANITKHPHPDSDVEGLSGSAAQHELPPRPEHLSGGTKFGRKLKDKLTHSTHEQRVAERQRREEEEARLYEQHQHIRTQMALAASTGVPQLIGKDRDGKDVYIEPPGGPGGFGGGGYGDRGYGYNPYTEGPYSNPNARFIKPPQPYARPYGYGGYGGGYGGYGYGGGYGGGYGFGAAPLLGLGGGLLLGGLLF